jgi:hypothetical protein
VLQDVYHDGVIDAFVSQGQRLSVFEGVGPRLMPAHRGVIVLQADIMDAFEEQRSRTAAGTAHIQYPAVAVCELPARIDSGISY